ncbi:hypothetical protein VST7929_01699 [Vibrio stylophorae]|uniref:N-acetyltransferase domain-containing protein n=1 Tax=Vibrio stylophorae TaxID=659351 RepID=A0ABM8ZU29_9VIBR|nr:N-acetyltransferase [Vibrio stylophorae]CAH0533824.1 hypothetical protein VST7929_01699 [Vibrio stylophorae]
MHFSLHSAQEFAPIERLFRQTFSDAEGPTEGALIGQLARDLLTTTPQSDCFCFVAIEQELIVGAIILTVFRHGGEEKAILLSPVAVATSHQGQGIGKQLITFGLNMMKEQGYQIAITYGDPNFYGKVGFEQVTEAQIPAPLTLSYPHGWLAQSLTTEPLAVLIGPTACASALADQSFW